MTLNKNVYFLVDEKVVYFQKVHRKKDNLFRNLVRNIFFNETSARQQTL